MSQQHYIDIDDAGRPHIASDFDKTDGLCRQMRCSRSGAKLAGIGSDDRAYERVNGLWHDRGPIFGPRSVIYRGEELLIRREWPAYGFRYIAADGTPITATDTYAHPSQRIWEYTELPNGILVGQGGDGPQGEDPCILIGADGLRRLVQAGMCRFINAYLVGTNILIAWQRDGVILEHAIIPVTAVAGLPDLDAFAPQPPPPSPPTPPVEPEPMPNIEALTQLVRTAVDAVNAQHPSLLQQNTKESCGQFTERVVVKLAAVDAGFGHVGKTAGQTNYHLHAVDAVMYKSPKQVWDIIGGAENHPHPGQPAANPVEHGGQPWMAPIPVDGEPTTPTPPVPPTPPASDVQAQITDLRGIVLSQESSIIRLSERLKALEDEPDLPPMPPLPQPLPELVARGRVSLGVFGSKAIELPVVPK